MDDKLQQVLHKVELLCEQNPEFAAALRNKLGVTVASSPVPVQDERIGKIEEYLGLDRKLDDIDNPTEIYKSIDYSFISDDALRDQLQSDFREMMRYRYGCRSHKADFVEYCKYAHFQLETLVNDFLEMWSLDDDNAFDINLAKKNINDNWPYEEAPKLRDNIEAVEDIDYSTKVTAIICHLKIGTELISRVPHSSIYYPTQNVFVVNYLSEVISYIRKIRNDYSHRGTIRSKTDSAIENYENAKKIDSTAEYGLQYRFDKNDKEVKYYMWKKSTRWDDVIKAISIILKADRKMYE